MVRATSYKRWDAFLQQLQERTGDNIPTWLRRPQWHSPEYRHIEPKWHLFTQRIVRPVEPEELPFEMSVQLYDCLWVTECGQTLKFSEPLLEVPELMLRKNTSAAPAVDVRCMRCDKQWRRLRAEIRRSNRSR